MTESRVIDPEDRRRGRRWLAVAIGFVIAAAAIVVLVPTTPVLYLLCVTLALLALVRACVLLSVGRRRRWSTLAAAVLAVASAAVPWGLAARANQGPPVVWGLATDVDLSGAILDDDLVLAWGDGTLLGVDAATGDERWQVALPGLEVVRLTANGQIVAEHEVSGTTATTWLDRDGEQLWSRPSAGVSVIAARDGVLVMRSCLGQEPCRITGIGEDGRTVWERDGFGPRSTVVSELSGAAASSLPQLVLVGDETDSEDVEALRADTGAVVAELSSVESAFLLPPDGVVAGTGDGECDLRALDADGGEVWAAEGPCLQDAVSLAGGAAYLSGGTGSSVLDVYTGAVTPVLAGGDRVIGPGMVLTRQPDGWLATGVAGARGWTYPTTGVALLAGAESVAISADLPRSHNPFDSLVRDPDQWRLIVLDGATGAEVAVGTVHALRVLGVAGPGQVLVLDDGELRLVGAR